MITDINLVNFRSYSNDSFELSPNVNIIVGPNASGKTNLLESILVVSRGFSYRAKDQDLIQVTKPWARVEAHTENFSRVVKIEKTEDNKASKTFNINTKQIKRLNLNQTIPAVLFEPNDLLILSGSPELRRNYLDDILEQTQPGFKSLKSHFKRVLAQRNTLLKQSLTKPELFVWNIRLSELGGQIFKERVSVLKELQSSISELYKMISGGKETIELSYETKCKEDDYESDLLKKLEHNIELDMIRGFTSFGPHRDDLKIFINGSLAGDVASRGESRTVLLTMKILEARIIEKLRPIKPILLFDDVFSELDGARRLALTKILTDYQAFITTTDADVVVQHFTQTTNIIPTNKSA